MTHARSSAPSARTLQFRYARLLRCGTCDAAVTAENKVNRYGKHYVYYHCGRKQRSKGFCSERCIEETDLEQQMLASLDELTLPQDVVTLVLEELQYQFECGADAQARSATLALLRRRLASAEESLVNLRRMRVEGEIGADDFRSDQAHYSVERDALVAQLRDVESQGVIEPLKHRVSLLNEAKSRFEAADDAKRREFLLEAVSNLSLRDRKLLMLAKEPFEALRALPKIPTRWAVSEIVRTLMRFQTQRDSESKTSE